MRLTIMLITMAINLLGDGRKEEKSEVPAKPVLRSVQGTATGNHTSRQEAPTNYDGKLQAPDEQCQPA
jgi:hypothetical protein